MKAKLILIILTFLLIGCQKSFEVHYDKPEFLVGEWFGITEHNDNLVGLSLSKEGTYQYQEFLAKDTSLLLTRTGKWNVVFVERENIHTVNFDYEYDLILTNEQGEKTYNKFNYDDANINQHPSLDILTYNDLWIKLQKNER
jgi:hypothetical protein